MPRVGTKKQRINALLEEAKKAANLDGYGGEPFNDHQILYLKTWVVYRIEEAQEMLKDSPK